MDFSPVLPQDLLPTSSPTFNGLSIDHLSVGGGVTTINNSGVIQTIGSVSTPGGTSADWNTAYTDRMKWDGGATGLVAATGRISLGLDSLSSPLFASLTLASATVYGSTSPATDGTYLYNGVDSNGFVKFYCAARGMYIYKNAATWALANVDLTPPVSGNWWSGQQLNGIFTPGGTCTGSPTVVGIALTDINWYSLEKINPHGNLILNSLSLGYGDIENCLDIDGVSKAGIVTGGNWSYQNIPTYIMGGTVAEATNPGLTGNTAGVETNLISYTMPTDAFGNVSDAWKMNSFGTTGSGVSTNKHIKIYFGSATIFDYSVTSAAPGQQFELDVSIVKYDTNKQHYCVKLLCSIGQWQPKVVIGQTTQTENSGLVLRITGNGTGANDVAIFATKLYYIPSRMWIP